MHWIDYAIFGIYLAAMLGIGFYFMHKNRSADDYFVGGRKMSSFHIGLSVVATDVEGGFSIGLGGLGFIMGLSGTWLLFTGLPTHFFIFLKLNLKCCTPKNPSENRHKKLFLWPVF